MSLSSGLRVAAASACAVFCLAAGAAARPHTFFLKPRPGKTAVRLRFVSRVPTAAELYERQLNADDHYSYRGREIKTNWRRGDSVAVIVSHRTPSLRRIDYITPERLQGQKFLSDGHHEWQYYPQQRLVKFRSLAPDADAVDDAASAYTLLKTNYLVSVVPQRQNWADRKVFLLVIARRSNLKVVRKLWVDAATGLVLKREYYNGLGRLAVTVAFSDINFHPKLTRDYFSVAGLTRRPGVRVAKIARDPETPIPVAGITKRLDKRWLTPTALAGYRLVGAGVTEGVTQGRPQLHLRYSDGLNLVSLFEVRRTQTRQPTRVPRGMRLLTVGSHMGHVGTLSSVTTINWDSGEFNLTLMGEMALRTLQRLAVAADARRP